VLAHPAIWDIGDNIWDSWQILREFPYPIHLAIRDFLGVHGAECYNIALWAGQA
jgi:hypothetical protein